MLRIVPGCIAGLIIAAPTPAAAATCIYTGGLAIRATPGHRLTWKLPPPG